jgi:hypothetical protein
MKYKDKNEERAWEMFRKSVGPHIWTGKDLAVWFCVGFFIGVLVVLPLAANADNEITMEQTGDTFQLGIDQIGHSNQILMFDNSSFITATSLDMYLVQYNTNPSAMENKIVFDEVTGSGNQMKLAQGVAWTTLESETDLTWYGDDYESGGHDIGITMYGDYNNLAVQQTNQTGASDGHNFDLHLAGDSNKVQIKQQSNGRKNTDLTIYNDYNDVFIRQKGTDATHNATITLDGLYGTDLSLIQMSTTNQTYTLSVDCMTVGGCSTSVLQE